MTGAQYDQLLEDIAVARYDLEYARSNEQRAMGWLDNLLRKLDQEDSRIAREALTSIHSASRKPVVGE